jgi:NTE family protein
LGDFEQVLFRLDQADAGRYEIEYLVNEKAWGPLFLIFGLRLEGNDERNTAWQILINLTRTQLNRLGGVWFTDIKTGDTMGLVSEWYRSLRTDRLFFVAPSVEIEYQTIYFIVHDQRIAEYDVNLYALNLDIGSQFRIFGEARLGVLIGYLDAQADLVTSDLPTVKGDIRALAGGVIIDRPDRSLFPREGVLPN